ncbi:MAG TPA: hypothetical protein VNH11_18680 [Pirellulales bacterium]|nr:hypothetical protein [Pirellulales bacterium]
MSIEQKLAALERRCRRLHGYLAVVAVAVLLPWMVGAKDNVQEVVRTRNFLLYDSDGKQRGTWMCHADGKAHFFLTSPDGKLSLVLVADNESSSIEADLNNEAKWIAEADAKGGTCSVISAGGKLSIALRSDDKAATAEAALDNAAQWIAGASAKGGRWAIRRDPTKDIEVRD